MIAHPVFERLVLRAGQDLAPAGIDGRRIARRNAVDARRFWRRLAGAAAEEEGGDDEGQASHRWRAGALERTICRVILCSA